MRINKLRFFVKRSLTSRVQKEVEFGYQPSDRDILSFMHEHKPIDLDGAKYSVHDVYAEPSKKTILLEMIISMFASFGFNLLFEVSTGEKQFLVIICSYLIFALIGLARIEKQKKMAKKFNNS